MLPCHSAEYPIHAILQATYLPQAGTICVGMRQWGRGLVPLHWMTWICKSYLGKTCRPLRQRHRGTVVTTTLYPVVHSESRGAPSLLLSSTNRPICCATLMMDLHISARSLLLSKSSPRPPVPLYASVLSVDFEESRRIGCNVSDVPKLGNHFLWQRSQG